MILERITVTSDNRILFDYSVNDLPYLHSVHCEV